LLAEHSDVLIEAAEPDNARVLSRP